MLSAKSAKPLTYCPFQIQAGKKLQLLKLLSANVLIHNLLTFYIELAGSRTMTVITN